MIGNAIMKKHISVLLATAALVTGCAKKEKETESKSPTSMADQTEFSKSQVAAIEKVIHSYIVNNPNVLAESIMNLQKKVADKQQERVVELLNKYRKDIDDVSTLPAVGRADADVTLVMFGDYTDPKSKMMFKMYQSTMLKDKKFRVVTRFLPDTSALAQKVARVAISMHKQGLFEKFHAAMLANAEVLTETSLMDIAGNISGVNRTKLESDMDSSAVKEAILNNRALADKLGIVNTPGYVVGDFLLKQAITQEDLEAVLKKLREKK